MKKMTAVMLLTMGLFFSTTASGLARRTTLSGTYRVAANSSHRFDIKFYAGSRSQVIIRGDRDTDLDLFIYDSQGRLVASDTDYSDQCAVYFTPSYTDVFIIVVKNHGNVWNQYALTAN